MTGRAEQPLFYMFTDGSSGISTNVFYKGPETAEDPTRESIRPINLLLEQAQSITRSIENTWWARPVQIDFDVKRKVLLQDGEAVPEGIEVKIKRGEKFYSVEAPLSPTHAWFKEHLTESLERQEIKGGKHTISDVPSASSDLILGFYDIPEGDATLQERVNEIPPMVRETGDKHDVKDMLKKNFAAVVTIHEDLAQLPKREMEPIVRMMMGRLGALKIIIINPDKLVAGTMEGGMGHEVYSDLILQEAFDRFRDRLVTHACAKDAGSYKFIKGAITQETADTSAMPNYIADAFRKFGEWDYIDKPYDAKDYFSKERAELIQTLMGWTRQSESAGAALDTEIAAPEGYQMGEVSGLLWSTKSGRNTNIDKRNLDRSGSIPVAIVPKTSGESENKLDLNAFDRYALGIGENGDQYPSVEFDEMAAVFHNSPNVKVSKHTMKNANGEEMKGWKIDPQGEYTMKRVRAFLHCHQAVSEIQSKIMWGKNVQDLVEYIPANLEGYPYPVGCGKDIQFAASTDAAARSDGVRNIKPGIMMSFFDAIDHGTNFLMLAEPLPGTDFIPDNPFEVLLELANPESGALRLTSDIAQI